MQTRWFHSVSAVLLMAACESKAGESDEVDPCAAFTTEASCEADQNQPPGEAWCYWSEVRIVADDAACAVETEQRCIGVAGESAGCGFSCPDSTAFYRHVGEDVELLADPRICGPLPFDETWLDCLGPTDPACACACA